MLQCCKLKIEWVRRGLLLLLLATPQFQTVCNQTVAADDLKPLKFRIASDNGGMGHVVVYVDEATPRGLQLNLKKRRRKVLGGHRTGVIVARFIPNAAPARGEPEPQNKVSFAWVNVVVEQKHTKPVLDSQTNVVSFPNIDPLPGRTEFGKSDSLPFYWD